MEHRGGGVLSLRGRVGPVIQAPDPEVVVAVYGGAAGRVHVRGSAPQPVIDRHPGRERSRCGGGVAEGGDEQVGGERGGVIQGDPQQRAPVTDGGDRAAQECGDFAAMDAGDVGGDLRAEGGPPGDAGAADEGDVMSGGVECGRGLRAGESAAVDRDPGRPGGAGEVFSDLLGVLDAVQGDDLVPCSGSVPPGQARGEGLRGGAGLGTFARAGSFAKFLFFSA